MFLFLFFIGSISLALLMTSTQGIITTDHLLIDFMTSLLRLMGQTLYIMIGYVFELSNHVVSACITCLPFVWKVVMIVASFVIWVVKQVLKGVLGTGDVFLAALSWVFCFCLFCLCLIWSESLFKSVNSNEIDDNNRNMIQEVNRRMEYENQENENEENSMEEAEINMASEDNDRNAVRELERRQINRILPQREPAAVFQGERLVVRLPEKRRRIRNSIRYIQIQNEGVQSESSDSEADGSSSDSETELAESRNENSNLSRNNTTVRRRQRNDSVDNAFCVVCFERQRNAAVFPCGHLHLCTECAESIMTRTKVCPTCQSSIQEYRRVYL
ncbi:E3 ubiquitin-protein ligase cblA-like [Saccostrea echinata]|uniref:E3 ubiquitin-protein ligase cblA-like n=1 Tax=Saccostrea echinata TaxID=191078 RepID=UPI002A817F27|nr:E3 ubiquitin-protein ligase cblA-like [Saccostrea echinata]